MKCLKKRINDRPKSAEELEAMLAAIPLEGLPTSYGVAPEARAIRAAGQPGLGDDPGAQQRAAAEAARALTSVRPRPRAQRRTHTRPARLAAITPTASVTTSTSVIVQPLPRARDARHLRGVGGDLGDRRGAGERRRRRGAAERRGPRVSGRRCGATGGSGAGSGSRLGDARDVVLAHRLVRGGLELRERGAHRLVEREHGDRRCAPSSARARRRRGRERASIRRGTRRSASRDRAGGSVRRAARRRRARARRRRRPAADRSVSARPMT